MEDLVRLQLESAQMVMTRAVSRFAQAGRSTRSAPIQKYPQEKHRPEKYPPGKDEKYQIDTDEFRTAVKHAESLAVQNGFITYHDLPTPWRINPFITHGYRFTPSLISSALSPVIFSNELANIWTHLLPILFVLRTTPPLVSCRADAILVAGYYTAVVLSLLCSGAWHSFRCCSRVRVMAAFVSVDIMAISLILTAFSVLTTHTAFYAQPRVGMVYITISLTWCIAGLFLPWTNFFRPVQVAPITLRVVVDKWPLSRSWTRVLFFCSLGVQGVIVPAVHATVLNGWAYTKEIYGLAAWVCAPISLGAIVYGSKFPERWWPGRFDYCGNSHNIWHVTTAVSAIMGCEVMGGMFEVAREAAVI